MSKERIAGRELDCEIAERVMGERLTWWDVADANGSRKGLVMEGGREATRDEAERYCKLPLSAGRGFVAVPVVSPYSVEAMRAKGWDVQIDSLGFTGEEWRTCFMRDGPLDDSRTVVAADAATLPLSLCLAALNAIETAAQIEAATSEKAQLSPSVSRSLPDTPRE